MTDGFVNYHECDTNQMLFPPTKKTSDTYVKSQIRYAIDGLGAPRPLVIMSPANLGHYGIGAYSKNVAQNHNLAVPLYQNSTDEHVIAFRQKLQNMDAKIQEEALNFFGSEKRQAEYRYSPMLYMKENVSGGDDIPIAKFWIEKNKDGSFDVEIYDNTTRPRKLLYPNKDAPHDDPNKYLPHGSRVRLMFLIKEFWVNKSTKTYGVKLYLKSVLVNPPAIQESPAKGVCPFPEDDA